MGEWPAWSPGVIAAGCMPCSGAADRNLRATPNDLHRRRLNGYLAEWVPSPPGKHTFKNITIKTHPKTAGKKTTRYPLG